VDEEGHRRGAEGEASENETISMNGQTDGSP